MWGEKNPYLAMAGSTFNLKMVKVLPYFLTTSLLTDSYCYCPLR